MTPRHKKKKSTRNVRSQRRRRRVRKQRGGLFPFLALIPAAVAAAAKAAAAGAVSGAAGHAAKGHFKRDEHMFTKKFWTGPKEVRRGGYIYSVDGKYRRKV